MNASTFKLIEDAKKRGKFDEKIARELEVLSIARGQSGKSYDREATLREIKYIINVKIILPGIGAHV